VNSSRPSGQHRSIDGKMTLPITDITFCRVSSEILSFERKFVNARLAGCVAPRFLLKAFLRVPIESNTSVSDSELRSRILRTNSANMLAGLRFKAHAIMTGAKAWMAAPQKKSALLTVCSPTRLADTKNLARSSATFQSLHPSKKFQDL